MNFAPTSGPIGVQPNGGQFRMVSKHASALAIGDVVMLSFKHSGAEYVVNPTSDADLRKSPFACVVKADGVLSGSPLANYVGVVTDLGSYGGLTNTEVTVQFGGIVNAATKAVSASIVLGSELFIGDATIDPSTVGLLSNAAGSTNPDGPVGIALNATTLASGSTATIPVLLFNQACVL